MASQFDKAPATCRAICLETWPQDGCLRLRRPCGGAHYRRPVGRAPGRRHGSRIYNRFLCLRIGPFTTTNGERGRRPASFTRAAMHRWDRVARLAAPESNRKPRRRRPKRASAAVAPALAGSHRGRDTAEIRRLRVRPDPSHDRPVPTGNADRQSRFQIMSCHEANVGASARQSVGREFVLPTSGSSPGKDPR